MGIEEGWQAMAELKEEGKVRHIGVSNFDVGQMKRAQAIAPVDSLQPPYSMLDRGIEDEILPYCREQNIAVIVYSLMKSGLLTGKMKKSEPRTCVRAAGVEPSEGLGLPEWAEHLPDQARLAA